MFSIDPQLEAFANELITTKTAAVISSAEPSTYLTIHDGTNFVYIQRNYYQTGYDFSVSYVPTKYFGSGQSILPNTELTIENAKRALTAGIHPDIQRYSSLAQYMKERQWLSLNYTDTEGNTTLYPKK